MKKILSILSFAAIAAMFVSCGGFGSKTAKDAAVTLGPLDDYYSVKSYKIESDAMEKGIEKLDKVKGTLTIVVKRNTDVMKYKPSSVDYADVQGELTNSFYNVFHGDCEAVVRKMLKMEPDSEETFTIGIKGIDPSMFFTSDEEKATNRQNAFDALTKKGYLDQISFDIEFDEDEDEDDEEDIDDAVKALKALKELADELDD